MRARSALAALMVLLLSPHAFSQGFKLGMEAGTALVERSAWYTGDVNRGGYGFSNLYSLGLKVRFAGPEELDAFTARATVLFTRRSGVLDPGPPAMTNNTSFLMVSFGFGYEATLSRGPIAPYVGANLLLNAFGDMKSRLSGASSQDVSQAIGVNAGIGFTAGVRFRLSRLTDLGVGVSYDMHNVVGTGFTGQSIQAPALNTYGLSVSVLTSVF